MNIYINLYQYKYLLIFCFYSVLRSVDSFAFLWNLLLGQSAKNTFYLFRSNSTDITRGGVVLRAVSARRMAVARLWPSPRALLYTRQSSEKTETIPLA